MAKCWPVILALLVGTLGALGLPAAPMPPVGGMKMDFENGELPARQKELLARYAEQVIAWASQESLVRAVQEQNAKGLAMDRIQVIDREWQRGQDPDGLATKLGRNDCARALLAILASHPGFGESFVTDAQGALVCMSRRTSDYWQGDEPKWSRAWADGAGAVFISRVAHDDSTGLDLMHISVPILVAGRPIGVLTMGKLLSAGGG